MGPGAGEWWGGAGKGNGLHTKQRKSWFSTCTHLCSRSGEFSQAYFSIDHTKGLAVNC